LVSQDQEPVVGIKTGGLGELWEQDRRRAATGEVSRSGPDVL